jgi:hypothetical protein
MVVGKRSQLQRRGWLFVLIVGVAICVEIYGHKAAHSILGAMDADTVRVFYNIPEVPLADAETSLATLLIYFAIARMCSASSWALLTSSFTES